MPSLAIPGRLATLEIDPGSGSVPYGGIIDVTMNVNVDELETTTHDSAGSRSYIPNHDDVTLDVSGRWFDGDPGQEVVLTAIFAKTTFDFVFQMETAAGKKIYTGSAFATTANPSGPLDDTGGMDVTFRCSSVIQSVQP